MFYHRRLLNHFLHLNEWLDKNDAQAALDMRTFQITISAYNQKYQLYPQFLLENDRILAYSPSLSPNVNGFIGWLPYTVKQWPLATNKILFKRYIEQAGKRTPQYWLSLEDRPENTLIKPSIGSFGKGQRGPWHSIDSTKPEQLLQQTSEFYERFRTGTILKAWYWNDKPICIELREPLSITGDGKTSVTDLIQRTYPAGDKALKKYEERKEALQALLAYQKTDWSAIPDEGHQIQIDYLYGSSLYPDLPGNANQLEKLRGTALANELENCGPIFWRTIPEETRRNTAYAVDGILSNDGEIRWLEINSNPMFPPDTYAIVLDSLFKE